MTSQKNYIWNKKISASRLESNSHKCSKERKIQRKWIAAVFDEIKLMNGMEHRFGWPILDQEGGFSMAKDERANINREA